jgi:hypothetical protein
MPSDIKTVEFVHFDDYNLKRLSRKYLKEQIKDIDEMIDANIGEPFIFYCPHTLANMQAIITNPNCVRFNYIQEGITDLFKIPFSYKNIVYWFQTKWICNKRFKRVIGWEPAKNVKDKSIRMETFAITDNLFKDICCKHNIVKWPSFEIDYSINEDYPVFVFDCLIEIDKVEQYIYIDAVNNVVNKYAKTNNYIKFHPQQSSYNRDIISSLFKEKGYNITLLPDSIPMELFLSSYPKQTVIGFSSSLVYFAKQMGHPVYQDLYLLRKSRKCAKYLRDLERNIKI